MFFFQFFSEKSYLKIIYYWLWFDWNHPLHLILFIVLFSNFLTLSLCLLALPFLSFVLSLNLLYLILFLDLSFKYDTDPKNGEAKDENFPTGTGFSQKIGTWGFPENFFFGLKNLWFCQLV